MANLILGIRHHGPGSARSLKNALEAFVPDIVLIEGPPEANALLSLAIHKEMQPPVALLVYVPDAPQQAVVYPFAEFSPEWQAIVYGVRRKIPVRFMDLPQEHWMAMRSQEQAAPQSVGDPLDLLAQAAGANDGEQWWERVVEERSTDAEVFPAILDAMTAVRESLPPDAPRDSMEAVREAAMRTAIRAAQQEGYKKIAVVCGAWHSPALLDLATEIQDRDLLRPLPRVHVSATWVPWSYGHLAFESGYGAGIASPGWYEHLWTVPHQTTTHWLGRVAQLLRSEDLDASSAQVIDAVRLAESLAAIRGRARPTLQDLNESALTVFCFGDALPLEIIRQKLIVGDKLGQVPSNAPIIPLQNDLAELQKRLRMLASVEAKTYDLDLREANALARSALLHQLNLLGVNWGRLERTAGAKGTFHEIWQVQWDPAFAVALVQAARWGNTVSAAATSLAKHRAENANTLADLTSLLDQILLADLPNAIAPTMNQIQARLAVSGDVAGLMDAVPSLARALRYGTVRETSGAATLDRTAFNSILTGLVVRVCIGLPLACSSLNDDAADEMLKRIEGMHESLGIIQRDDLTSEWQNTLAHLANQNGLHGLVAGRVSRLLMDRGALSSENIAQRLRLALSIGTDPSQGAAWLGGFLRGSGLILLHDDALWKILDEWVASLSAEYFVAVLPLLRRTFSAFPFPERRQMGERVAHGAPTNRTENEAGINIERANTVLPLVKQLLGLKSAEE
jgi:hypothetical protein